MKWVACPPRRPRRWRGLDRVRFLFALECLGVSFINVDEDELKQEFAHAREAFARHQ